MHHSGKNLQFRSPIPVDLQETNPALWKSIWKERKLCKGVTGRNQSIRITLEIIPSGKAVLGSKNLFSLLDFA